MEDLLLIVLDKLASAGPWGVVLGAALTIAYHRFRGLAGAPTAPKTHPVTIAGKPVAITPEADLGQLPPAELAQLKKLIDGALDTARSKLAADQAALK